MTRQLTSGGAGWAWIAIGRLHPAMTDDEVTAMIHETAGLDELDLPVLAEAGRLDFLRPDRREDT